MNQKFEVSKQQTPEGVVLALSGAIVEGAAFPLHMVERTGPLTLDFHAVTRINSSGIRLWLEWMGGIRNLRPQMLMTVSRCPKFIVDLMNSFSDFVPSPFIVESFYIPFYCDPCRNYKDELFVRGTHFNESAAEPDKVALPQVNCPACGREMEADIFPENYFKFLKLVKQNAATRA